MKNYLKFVFIFSFLLSLTAVNAQNRLKTGFYYLADKESEGEWIKDIDTEEKFAVNKQEILTVADFSGAKLKSNSGQPSGIKVIQLKLTKEGRKKWTAIKNKISATGESIVFICNDRVYIEKRMIGKTKPETAIDLFFESKYSDAVFQMIQSEISNNK